MDRADRVIELLEEIVGVIEEAVGRDDDLARFENTKPAQPAIQRLWTASAPRDPRRKRLARSSDFVKTSILNWQPRERSLRCYGADSRTARARHSIATPRTARCASR